METTLIIFTTLVIIIVLFKIYFNRKNTKLKKILEADIYSEIDVNKQIRPRISEVNFFKLKKSDFIWEVLEPISKAVAKHRKENNLSINEGVKIISQEQKLIFFWWYLDAQVSNGGFSQFIYNGYDKYFVPILNGLKLLENKEYYNLVEKIFIYSINNKLFKIDRTNIDYFESKLYKNSILTEADSEYFKIKDKLYENIEHFIRNNQEKFIKPITTNRTGTVKSLTNDIIETLEVINDVPNGIYQKRNKKHIEFEEEYIDGKIICTKNYMEGILIKSVKNEDNYQYTYDYYKNQKLKQLIKKNLEKEAKYKVIIRNRFYENGIKKAEEWLDKNEIYHIKRYFKDGKIRSYHTIENSKPIGSNKRIVKYLICYDENKIQCLEKGKGIFYDYDFEEDSNYSFYSSIIKCDNFLANGKFTEYKNKKKWLDGNYRNGKENGIITKYNEDGTIEARKLYENGEYIKTVANKV